VVDDLNPSTGKIYARVQQAGAEEVERAIASAYRARESWGGSLVAEREGVLFRAADILATRMQEIRDVLIDESGSTFGKSMFEVASCHRPLAQFRRRSTPCFQRNDADVTAWTALDDRSPPRYVPGRWRMRALPPRIVPDAARMLERAHSCDCFPSNDRYSQRNIAFSQ
jgi:acyl-CoA reductase-like NAD-dependent aldehyde dehydrogenase